MNNKIRQGQFKVIDSFAIRRRNEFYLIGQIAEGTIRENWFINVPLNKSLSMTLRIKAIEDVEMSGEQDKYKLVIVSGDNQDLDIFLGLNMGLEDMDITEEGQD